MQATIHIPGYEQFEQVALGGMATVYKARKISIDKLVAIKVLFPHLAADDGYLRQFKHEAQIAARVQHDNIVNVLDYGVSEGQHFIVMEYYEGRTLEELLVARQGLPTDVFFAVVLGVCYGLEAAHSEDLVHRDIKPANIILTHHGAVKIADFGLARDTKALQRSASEGRVVGTPAYMSPEQTRGGQVRAQSDIFSLGVVAHELLSGERPFEGNSYPEVLDAIQNKEPARLTGLRGSPLLERIVSKMMAKSLADRYDDVSSIILDLDEALDQSGFKRNPRMLAEYYADPAGYHTRFNSPTPGSARGERDQPAARHSMSGGAATDLDSDPGTEYRVFLDDIDRFQESPESFALKVAMKIKMPVPRVNALLRRVPTEFAGHLPHAQAQKLARVLTSLGGQVRVEPYSGARRPRPAVKGSVPEKAPDKPQTPSAKKNQRTAICPGCGWEEAPGARFCSVCNHMFNKTETLSLDALRGQQGLLDKEPLAAIEDTSPKLLEYLKQPISPAVAATFAGGAAIVIVGLLVILTIALSR